jgi:glycosyltransferase involved in cell wall biosynthesis
MPVRFLLVSTHTEQMTGYSKVSYNLLKQLATLQPLVKLFHYGFQRSIARPPQPLRPLPAGVVQYDAALNEEPREEGFGFNKFKEYVDTVEPNIIMIYNDALIVNRFLESLKLDPEQPKPFKIWIYLDQVYRANNRSLIQNMEKYADRFLVFTERWKQEFVSHMTNKEIPVDVLEHGVDTTLFKRLSPAEHIGLRANLKIPTTAVVFLNVNRNSERKRLDLTVMAFVRYLKKHPNSFLLMATGAKIETGGHYELQSIFLNEVRRAELDIETYANRLMIVDTSPPNIVTDEVINQLYNIADVGINTSNGEGFGLCQLEHMATGSPQVVLDVGDYHCFMDEETAVFVKPTEYSYLPARFGLGLIAESSTPDAFADGLDKALTLNRDKCVEKAKARPWSRVCDAFLEDIAQTYVKN